MTRHADCYVIQTIECRAMHANNASVGDYDDDRPQSYATGQSLM